MARTRTSSPESSPGSAKKPASKSPSRKSAPDAASAPKVALVLQGGGALGAYQGGVYEGLHDAGLAPDWIAGISIGAFNTAIIAGNPPHRRVGALREFWETITQPSFLPPTLPAGVGEQAQFDAATRGWLDAWEAMRAVVEGQSGFYLPRTWMPQDLFTPPGTARASWYDTTPLRRTLERLVDFDRLNDGGIRVSVGAVDVASANIEYFDNAHMRLDVRHILASGALPPAFPAIEIDGRWFWDGGLVSNTPLSQLFDAGPRFDALVFQVDLWSAAGELPVTMPDVAERQKEIQYSSRTRLITDMQRMTQHYRRVLRELLEEIPEDVRRSNPWCQHAARLACDHRYGLIHLIYRDRARGSHFKDYQFGPLSMREHWQCGLAEVRRALANPGWLQLPTGENSFAVHDASAG